jgi:post-segregation antitoxin (ccd killing protein)
MLSEEPRKAKLTVNLTLDESTRVKLIELRINPSSVLRTALNAAIRKKEMQLELRKVRAKDPRVTEEDLKANGIRIRRLRGI